MKKLLLAAPLPLRSGDTRSRQRRQVGPGPGGRCVSRQHELLAGGASSYSSYNNVAGPRVTSLPASANPPGTYLNWPGHNNRCNYSVEGGILASSNNSVEAVVPARAIELRLPAQAASFCPDSEQLSNFSTVLAHPARHQHPMTPVSRSDARLASCQVSVASPG